MENDTKLIRAHVLVRGRVQGVFFRDSTREQAEAFGVSGWVKNLEDGGVEGVFEGQEQALQKLVDFVHEGPPMAAVEEVEVTYSGGRGEFEGFEILA